MKYIRTKDEIIPTELPNGWKLKCVGSGIEIIKQADTIEELCDRFVVVEHNLDDPFNVDFETAKTFIGKAKVYGAIWTDKGLIYVAKMSDKGDLELL